MKRKYNSYKILKKLAMLSSETYGFIEFDDKFNSKFDVPTETLYKIFALLSNNIYIDFDYLDVDKCTFQTLTILPNGYQHLYEHKVFKVTNILAGATLLIAVVSLVVALCK